jgi:hypothetical protein
MIAIDGTGHSDGALEARSDQEGAAPRSGRIGRPDQRRRRYGPGVSWVETSRALRPSSLSPSGLARLGQAVEIGVEVVRTLHGGVASSVHQLRAPTRVLVLKRFSGKDGAILEWERLHAALAVPVPTAVPFALDSDGEWFGAPAFVVTYVEGEAMHPPRPETLGRLLVTIHSIPNPSQPSCSAPACGRPGPSRTVRMSLQRAWWPPLAGCGPRLTKKRRIRAHQLGPIFPPRQ